MNKPIVGGSGDADTAAGDSVQLVSHDVPIAASSHTLAIGQSNQPTRVIQFRGVKEIDYFLTMKVIFINGHVTDVQ